LHSVARLPGLDDSRARLWQADQEQEDRWPVRKKRAGRPATREFPRSPVPTETALWRARVRPPCCPQGRPAD